MYVLNDVNWAIPFNDRTGVLMTIQQITPDS